MATAKQAKTLRSREDVLRDRSRSRSTVVEVPPAITESPAQFWSSIKGAFAFPDYCGENLNALEESLYYWFEEHPIATVLLVLSALPGKESDESYLLRGLADVLRDVCHEFEEDEPVSCADIRVFWCVADEPTLQDPLLEGMPVLE